MARIDFYVLSDDGPDARLRFACRLADKAVEQGNRIHMQLPSAAEAQRLDDMLWMYNDRSFLPHEIVDGQMPTHPRVMVTLGIAVAPPQYRQLLINLTDDLPTDLDSYERIAEIVDADPQRKRIARERYKQYRERGCALESHNI